MSLTKSRSKPSLPLIDFVLNNFVNSGIIRIYLITRYKSQSLHLHLKNSYAVSGIPNCFIEPIPAHMRTVKSGLKEQLTLFSRI
ncbi:hypothetical protein [uncultured Succinatimonas sp.]|uniref:hypothetical protein n=1 Tax=uncultured Succinatimonas sp. TaxID=1262973 RepID=UPI0034588993